MPTSECVCEAHSLASLLHNTIESLAITNFGQVWIHRVCPFCKVICRVIERSCTTQTLATIDHHVRCGKSLICHVDYGVNRGPRHGNLHNLKQLTVSVGKRREDRTGNRQYEDIKALNTDFLHLRQIAVLEPDSPNNIPDGSSRFQRRLIPPIYDVDELRHWLSACERTHDHVIFDRTGLLKHLADSSRFRLIDIRSCSIRDAAADDRYVALSYVCGWQTGCKRPVTTTNPISDGLPGPVELVRWLNKEILPKTIADAISLTEKIGERYLWVDAICIHQEDLVDRAANVAAMGAIYSNSIITIVAGEGNNAEAGLAGIGVSMRSFEEPFVVISGETRITLLPARQSLQDLMRDTRTCTWNTRAWTYQEWLLSFRCIFVFGDEIYCTCPESHLRQAYVRKATNTLAAQNRPTWPKESGMISARMVQAQPLQLADYTSMVANYTRMELTDRGDRLAAFTGVLQRFVQATSTTSFSGIPLAFMYSALFWRSSEREGPDMERILVESTGRVALPSWSWAGWYGPVRLAGTGWEPAERLRFVATNKWNIVGLPSTYQGDPPPVAVQSEAEELLTSRPERTTLHLKLPVLKVRLSRMKSCIGAAFSMHHWEQKDVEEAEYLGKVRVRADVVAVHGLDRAYEVAYWGGSILTAWVLIDNDGFWERISYRHDLPQASASLWESLSRPKYLKLR